MDTPLRLHTRSERHATFRLLTGAAFDLEHLGGGVMNLTGRGLQHLDSTTFNRDTCKNVRELYLSCNDLTTLMGSLWRLYG